MKMVLSLSESAELELLKDILEQGGIHCVLKHVELGQALPILPFNSELWVLNDADWPAAQALCQDWFKPEFATTDFWDCPHCGQRLGNRFDSCWKCGTRRSLNHLTTGKGAAP